MMFKHAPKKQKTRLALPEFSPEGPAKPATGPALIVNYDELAEVQITTDPAVLSYMQR